MVRAAVALYREHGMGGTGFTDVLDAVGAARGAIYHHFPGGKEELAAEVVATHGRDVHRSLGHLLKTRPPGDAIRGLCSAYADHLERTNLVASCPIAPTVLEAGLKSDAVATAAVAAFDGWRNLLASALRERSLPNVRARRLAETVVAAIEGALILCRAYRSPRSLRDVGAELARILDDAIAPARAGPKPRGWRGKDDANAVAATKPFTFVRPSHR